MASKAIQNAVVIPETKPVPLQDVRPRFTPRPHPPPLLQPSNHGAPNLGPPIIQNQVPMHMQGPMQHSMQAPPNQLPPPPIPPSMPLPHRIPPMIPQMVPNPGALPVMGPVGVSMVPMSVALPGMPVAGTVGATGLPMMTPEEHREWESTYSQPGTAEAKDKKKTKEKKFLRVAGTSVWEDNSLAEWEKGKAPEEG